MKILKLHPQKPLRLGHKKVSKNKLYRLEDEGQLNLFKKPKSTPKIIPFSEDLSPFEFAFKQDEEESVSAKEAYHKAIESKDRVADAYCNLGILEAKNGNDVQAINNFSQALINEPRHYEAHFNMANVYFDNENYPLARLHYQTALEIEPNDPNIYFNLGLVEALQENIPEAIQSLSTYTQMVSSDEGAKANELLDQLNQSSKH